MWSPVRRRRSRANEAGGCLDRAPLVVGGTGGSGTRVVRSVLARAGAFMGVRDSILHHHRHQRSWPFFFISARTRVIMSVDILPCQPCIAVTTSVRKAGCVSTYFFT